MLYNIKDYKARYPADTWPDIRPNCNLYSAPAVWKVSMMFANLVVVVIYYLFVLKVSVWHTKLFPPILQIAVLYLFKYNLLWRYSLLLNKCSQKFWKVCVLSRVVLVEHLTPPTPIFFKAWWWSCSNTAGQFYPLLNLI